MILGWFDSRQAEEIGASLADQLAPKTVAESSNKGAQVKWRAALAEILERADREVRTLQLNFYKSAKFANSFKWRLLDNGVSKELASEVTQTLVMHLSSRNGLVVDQNSGAERSKGAEGGNVQRLLSLGNKYMSQGAYSEAISVFRDLLTLDSGHPVALNNLGAALCKQGKYQEAESCFRHAIESKPENADSHSNLGTVLRWRGYFAEGEASLRRALRLNPKHIDARVNLGLALTLLSRLREASGHFKKVLKVAPRNADALFGMALVAQMDGRFDESRTLVNRVLEVNPKMPSALASLAGTRKMTPSDSEWLRRAKELAASGIAPLDEAELRFAIGKYHDDVAEFEDAFQSYKRGNELMKAIGENYDRKARTAFADAVIRTYTPGVVNGLAPGFSESKKPVLVVGMMRSGTSLMEQIIASHPSAKGAGELVFWSEAVRDHKAELSEGSMSEATRKRLAEAYLRTLESAGGDALRIIDKTPVNSDYLGVIHSVFPNARIIHMQRDPIDTCLSCYFQKFSLALNFTMDLSDLAHYYREHHRLMAHWRAVLPPATLLEVPYAELVSDQEAWTRRILDFLELEWDARCLDFYKTDRAVVTASFWQVRQKIYKNSVLRWHNYEKFIGPLLKLRDLQH